jgi:hypothetical protein
MLDAEPVQIEPIRESGMPGTLLKTFFYKIGDYAVRNRSCRD